MDTSNPGKEKRERLHGLNFDGKGLTLWVTSTGCTKKEDFRITITPGATATSDVSLEVVRLKPDLCKTVSHVTELVFSWKELGIDVAVLKTAPVKVLNKFGVLR